MSSVLSIKNLNKSFGRIHAVNDLNLEIPAGSVFGLLGPNGSGKTTTLGMLLGVVRPSSGEFSWFGESDALKARKSIGAILESPTFYPYLSAIDNLKIVAKIKGLPLTNMDEVLNAVNLLERKDDKFKSYSLGMKQRLAIASAMLCDPRVLVLDEPTNGLDPMGIAEIRDIIRRIAAGGKTIILASHLLDEVQKVCSDFAILRNGKMIHSGKVSDRFNDLKVVEVSSADMQLLKEKILEYPGFVKLEEQDEKLSVTIKADSNTSDLNAYLFEKGLVLNHLTTRSKSLEEQFLEIVGKD